MELPAVGFRCQSDNRLVALVLGAVVLVQGCSTKPEPTPTVVTFVRHGLSCGNALAFFAAEGDKSAAHALEVDKLLDPPLTDCGVGKSLYAGQQIKEQVGLPDPDFVYASTLLRAQETATQVYPGFNIQVVPYIHEAMGEPWQENTPGTVQAQQEWLRSRPELVVDGVAPTVDASRADEEHQNAPDFDKFLEMLAGDLAKAEGPKHVGVVSHGMTMMMWLNGHCSDLQLTREQVIHNNIAVQVTFADKTLTDAKPSCKVAWGGNALPSLDGAPHLCAADIERCPAMEKGLVVTSQPCTCLGPGLVLA